MTAQLLALIPPAMCRAWRLVFLAWVVTDVLAIPQKVRVISDIHAGSCWQGNQTMLFEFLERTAQDDVDVLVLNGDVYDFWLVPLNKTPPSFNDSVHNGLDPAIGFDMARFRRLLRAAAKSVVALQEDNGNHDMWLSPDLAQQAVGDEASVLWKEDAVQEFGIRFEHGHLHSLFNNQPPGTNKMPIGYFVTRCVASYTCASQSRIQSWLADLIEGVLGTSIIDDVAIETLRQPTVFKSLLHRILETAADSKIPDAMAVPIVGVVASDQIPKAHDQSTNYTLAHFIEEYADTLDRFASEYGLAASAKMVEVDVVSGALDQNVGEGSVQESVVVVGHTHVPTLQVIPRDVPYFSKTPDVLVANAGAWVSDDAGTSHHSYVDLTIDHIVEDYPECYTAKNGSDYRGTVHQTENGTACIPWGTERVTTGPYAQAFGGTAFCRNLGDQGAPWCRTGVFSWGNCSVGPPAAHCPHERLRGAVAVELFNFPSATPVASATRNYSTGSRWTMTGRTEHTSSDATAIVV